MSSLATHSLAQSGAGYRVLSGPAALSQVEHTYRYLWARTDPVPPTLDFDWVRAWWHLHRREGDLFLVQVEQDGLPIGLAPLYVRRREASARGALRAVCFLGTGERDEDEVYGTNNGWLALPQHQNQVTRAVAAALRRHADDWDRLWLANVASPALAEDLHADLDDALEATTISEASNWIVEVPATLDDYYAAIPKKKQRTKLRAVIKKADAAGVTLSRAQDPETALAMFDELVELHDRHWKARGERGACASPVFRQFHREVIPTLCRQQRLWMIRMATDDRLLGVRYLIQAGDRLYGYLSGFDGEDRSLAPGILSTLKLIEQGPESGIRAIDLLAGDYGYKHRIANRQLPLKTLEGFGRTSAARAFLGLRRLKQRLTADD